MQLKGVVALLLTLNLFSEHKANRLDNLAEYVESVVQCQIKLKPTRTFNIWINWISPQFPYREVTSKILAKPTLQHIPRVVLKISSVDWNVAVDTYSIIFIDLSSGPPIHNQYMRTYFIAIGEFHMCDQLRHVAEFMRDNQEINVAYFSTSHNLMCCYKPYFKQFESFRGFPPPTSLFPDQTGDLGGCTIVASAITGPEMKRTENGDLVGPEVSWIKETARSINASTKFFSIDCNDTLQACLPRISHYRGQTVDVILNRYIMFETGAFESVEPLFHSIHVPRGRFLTEFEMFAAPFDSFVWIMLGLLIIVFKLLEQLSSNLLRDGFTFLTFCGFLDYTNLRRLSRTELFSSIAITMTLFFLFRAYETKIISMMVNMPRHPTVQNLQQLIDARLNVKVDYRTVVIPYGVESPLAKLVTHDTEHLTEPLDGFSAYFLQSELAEALIFATKNVDPATREPRYVSLDERFIMSIGFYTIGIFTLYDRLKFTQRMLFETGIRQLWKRNFRNEQYAWLNEEVVVNDKLQFAHILPAWIVLGVGLGLSTLVFAGELLNLLKSKVHIGFKSRQCLKHLKNKLNIKVKTSKKK